MLARTQIARIRQIQRAFSIFAVLNITTNIYPRDAEICDGESFDYVVVGGGTSGAIAAARLVEAKYSVLVIEAGDIPGSDSLHETRNGRNLLHKRENRGKLSFFHSSNRRDNIDVWRHDHRVVIEIRRTNDNIAAIISLVETPKPPARNKAINHLTFPNHYESAKQIRHLLRRALFPKGKLLMTETRIFQYPGFVPYIKNSRIDWNYTSETNCRTDRCLKADGGSFYGRGLGGTGALNYMIYGRGNPRDFEKFYEATGDPSWRWDNMLKYFIKSEKLQNNEILSSEIYAKFHGTEGNIGVTKEDRAITEDYLKGYEEAGEEVVIDNVGSGIGLGYSKCLYTILKGKRNDAGNTYLSFFRNNPKLCVTRNSLATKIIFDENKNAVGVEFVKEGKIITVKAKKEVIVSAGPVKSPQLLMLSGIGPQEELETHNINVLSDLPVGKNLQCVIGAFLDFKTNIKANPPLFDEHRLPAPIILGYSALNKCSIYPDYETQNFIIDDYYYFLSLCAFTLKLKNSICDRLLRAADNKQMLVTILLNINPKSRGNVSLYSSNPNDQPKIVYGYYNDEADLNATVQYIQHYMTLKDTPYFQSLGLEFLEATAHCAKLEFGSYEYWRCYALCLVALTGRTTGTCAMGSVVDSQLRVLGVQKLRVVGASVMPNSLGGAIFAPEVALAEKAAEMIIADGKN